MSHAEKCPVCGGNGLVPQGFYLQCTGDWTSGGLFEPCRSCKGEGWIVVDDPCIAYIYELREAGFG